VTALPVALAVLLSAAGVAVAVVGLVANLRDPRPAPWAAPGSYLVVTWSQRRADRARRQALASWLLAVAAGLLLPPWGIGLATGLAAAGALYAWDGHRAGRAREGRP
jgi:hypothetical protein